ncbi:MAG: putative metal-dependent hydrolase [Candidatus Aldehydirespiratoraceae bacterium]|jgi:predicted metal-dependent hydrolase
MAATITPKSALSGRKVPTRRMFFEESLAELPKHFAGDGDLIGSHLAAVLSSVFPDGEDFFVRSVRNFRDQIDDADLKRDVAGFIGQEAIHGREHRVLNNRLADLGYPTKRLERSTKFGLGMREKFISPMGNLAATAALEHFTATIAALLLSNEEARKKLGIPELRDLLLWHALEECEHKAVAFDVYKAVGGSEKTRRRQMNAITATFLGGISFNVFTSLLRDRETYRRGNLRASIKRMKNSPMFTREVWRDLRDYNRVDFHPNDHDTDALLDQWRDELFGDEGRLNHMLAGAA